MSFLTAREASVSVCVQVLDVTVELEREGGLAGGGGALSFVSLTTWFAPGQEAPACGSLVVDRFEICCPK